MTDTTDSYLGRHPRLGATATVTAGVVFAGAGLIGDGGIAVNALVAVAAAILAISAWQLTRPLVARGIYWGGRLVIAGFVSTVIGSLLNAIQPTFAGQTAEVVALAAIPAWIAAHLVYVGATVLGVSVRGQSDWRQPIPRLLIASLPVLLIGVSGGLMLGDPAAHYVTWVATEGQVGVVWLLIGVTAGARARGYSISEPDGGA